MPVAMLKQFLDEKDIKYVTVSHSKAYTAQDVAASAHIPGRQLAKTVVVKLGEKVAMAVLPAPHRVDLVKLGAAAGQEARLCSEEEFKSLFPGCETGAMPPFGNLYDMDVWVSAPLAEDEEIAFNAGSHTELVRLAYADFSRLVDPSVATFSAHE